MTEIEIVRNDQNFDLEFTIYDADGVLVNLNNVTEISLRFKLYSDSSIKSISGEVVDPDAGKAKFPVGETFVGLLGEYKGEIQIKYSDGKILTAPNISIRVIPDI